MAAAAAGISMWSTLVPVITGGVIGLVGGWLGPWLLERKKEAAEKKKRRADKLEEPVDALYAFDHWIDTDRLRFAYGEDHPREVSPFAKLRATAAVYFPQFNAAIDGLDTATSGYRVWMSEAGQRRLAGQTNSINDGFNEAYKPYLLKREALVKILTEFARTEFR